MGSHGSGVSRGHPFRGPQSAGHGDYRGTGKYPRGPYGGAVGYISFTGNMDLAITIRTACTENGRLTVNAGAGIVYDSDPEKERQETVNKAMAIQKALRLMEAAS